MDEQTVVVMKPAMDENGNILWSLKSLGVNVKLPKHSPEPTGWVSLELPSGYELYVTQEKTDKPNTLSFEELTETLAELRKSVEAGLTDKESW